MSTPLNTILSWFQAGDFPTEQQFAESWKSFYHKEENIPVDKVENLNAELQNKADASAFETHLISENSHNATLAKLDASNLNGENTQAWKTALGVEALPNNIALIDNLPFYGNVWSKEQSNALYMIADEFVSNGKIMASKIEALGLTELITVTETSLTAFLTNNIDYQYEKNDIIAIPDISGNYSLYIYKGGSKTTAGNYIPTGLTNITIAMVQGLQTALDAKMDKPTIAGNYMARLASGTVTWRAINPSSNYLTFWNGSDFSASSLYYDGAKFGIGTTTPGEMLHLNNGRLRAKAIVFDENTETLPYQITHSNRRFYGTDLTGTARMFMYRDFTDYKSLWEGFTDGQKNEIRTIINVSEGYKGFLQKNTVAPTISGLYRLLDIGTYPNLTPAVDENGNTITITAIDGKINDAYFDGTKWVLSKITIPGTTALTTFDKTNNVSPSTMKATYDSSDVLVKKALAGDGSSYTKYGWDINNASVSNSPSLVCNLAYLNAAGKIRRITIKGISTTATFEIYKVNAGSNPVVGNALTKTLITTVSLTSGTNVIDVDINGIAGDMIAVKNTSGSIGYTDGGANKYFDASGSTILNLNSGYISYYFETVDQGVVEYPLDNLKDIVKINNSDFTKLLNGSDGTIHSRITIEGQSNALGVALASGLTASPFNTALFDWTKYFSRVFIWNPHTDQYENIKIGVNNMASWDGFYTIGAPTSQPTFGAEIGIALIWLQTHPYGNLYIDKNVGDGQPISYFQKGTAYYTEKMARKTKADQWLKDRGISVSEIGFLWVQGEGNMSQTKAYYKSQLTTLISDRISDGFIDSKGKIVIAQIPSTSANYGVGVADAKTEFVNENKMSVLLPYTNNFNADNIHLNTTGQINLGMKAAANILVSDSLLWTNVEKKSFWTF